MRSIFLPVSIILLSYFLSACYTPYKNGEPCFYIKDKHFQGDYEFLVERYDTNKFHYYKNSYNTLYPNKENCITYNAKNFSDYEPTIEYAHYLVDLSTRHKKYGGLHHGSFCLIRDQHGVLAIIEPEYNCELYRDKQK